MRRDRARFLRHWLLWGTLAAAIPLTLSCGKRDPLRDLATATVASIRDGDTIELTDGRVVRYVGIDTPEVGQPWADSATAFNTNLVMGKEVRLEQLGDRVDRYGRTLAVVFVGNKMVNLEILKAGLAWCYFFRGNLKYAQPMIAAARGAMDARVGLWSDMGPGDEERYVGSYGGFRFHRPECPSVQQIDVDDERDFTVRDSAFYFGYSPCKSCRP